MEAPSLQPERAAPVFASALADWANARFLVGTGLVFTLGACAGSRSSEATGPATRAVGPQVEAVRVERVITHTGAGQTITSEVLELRHGTRMFSQSEAVGVIPKMTMLWDFGTQSGWLVGDELEQFAAMESGAPPAAATRSLVAIDLGLSTTTDGSAVVVPNPALQPISLEIPSKIYGAADVVAAMRIRGTEPAQSLELWVVSGIPLTATDYANAWRRRLPAPRTSDEDRLLAEFEALPGYPAVVRTHQHGQTVVNEVVSATKTQVAASRFDIPADYQEVESTTLLTSLTDLQDDIGQGAPERSARSASKQWQQILPRSGDELHFYLYFQDADSVWQCENKQCRVVHGDHLGQSVELPCFAASHRVDFSSPSRSGRWLALGCEKSVHVVDMQSGTAHATELGEGWLYSGVIDDDGTATVSMNGTTLVRIPRRGQARTFPVQPPRLNSGDTASVAPAHAPWLGFSEGAFSDDVGWLEGTPPKLTKLGGGAFFNGSHVWVSLMVGGYVELDSSGSQTKVSGRFGGGLGGKGLLMDIAPWGERGVLVEYEEAALLLDDQLETVLQVDLPPMDGMLHVGADPLGRQLHAGSPYGALYVRRLPKEVSARSAARSRVTDGG